MGNHRRGYADAQHPGVRAPPRDCRPGDDQRHLGSGGNVLRAEPVNRGAQTYGARTVEVGDLNDPHPRNENGPPCVWGEFACRLA